MRATQPTSFSSVCRQSRLDPVMCRPLACQFGLRLLIQFVPPRELEQFLIRLHLDNDTTGTSPNQTLSTILVETHRREAKVMDKVDVTCGELILSSAQARQLDATLRRADALTKRVTGADALRRQLRFW